MTFEERNSSWEGHARTFLQMHSRGSAPRVWGIRVEGNQIHTTWGQYDGAMQTAIEHMQGVNLGKKNEKTPAQYALERAREMCRKKNWEGYREVGSFQNDIALTTEGQPVFLDPVVKSDIDFDNLPLSLCFYKPDNSMGSGITKKAEAGKVWYARKANGMMFVIAKGSGQAKLYSRRMLRHQDDETGQEDKTWDRRFMYVQGAAEYLMPPNSILLGELVVRSTTTEEEDFKAIQSLTKSLTDEAFTKLVQIQAEFKTVSFYCWDIAFWDGKDLVKEVPVRERYELMHEVLDGIHIHPVQFYTGDVFPTPSHAIEFAKEKGWEGFVVVDPDGVYGDKAYNFKGKPDRPGTVCAKLKPSYEDDFVALWDPEKNWGERSTKARNNQGIKCVSLWQYNVAGVLVYISDVSSGLSDEQKREWAHETCFPMVWKIEYTDRRFVSQGDDTNALDFARFIEVRTDKKPAECINAEL